MALNIAKLPELVKPSDLKFGRVRSAALSPKGGATVECDGLTGGGNELALSWHSIRNRLDPSVIGAGVSNLGFRHRWFWWLSHRRPYLRVPRSRCRAMPRYLSSRLDR